jgi:DnaJ-class molecular chaperone
MENYYKLLDLDQAATREQIEEALKELNKEYRRRSNHKDAKVRNEAGDKLKLVQQAMVRFRSDEDRSAYDAELTSDVK